MPTSKLIRDIEEMRIRSATRIALASLKYLKEYAHKKGFGPGFRKETNALLKIRPTAVVFANAMAEVESDPSLHNIETIISHLEHAKEKIAVRGKKLIKGKTVMTHCESTEAEALMIAARPKLVYVTETRPIYQGFDTAKRIAAARVKVKLITDNAAGYFLPECRAVVVGSDSMRKEGLVNKIGTIPLAIMAKEMGIPFYVAGNIFKLDSRRKFGIEMRNPNEIRKPMKGVRIVNPAFDITPWKYVTAVVTDKGVYKPGKIISMIKRS